MTSGWRWSFSAWLSIDRRLRIVLLGILAALTVAWLSSPLYMLGALAIAAAATAVRRRGATTRWRGLATLAVSLLGLAALAYAFHGASDQGLVSLDKPRPVVLSLPPSPEQVRALVAADPASSDAWMAAGFYLPRATPTDPGVVALERVLLKDPSQSRAALELASTFLDLGRTQIDEEIAAYYLAVAGYPVSDLPRRP
jgi:hypothetical protein